MNESSDNEKQDQFNILINTSDDVELKNVGELKLAISNGAVPSDFFSQNPCTVGYSYIRFEVDGKIRPCCISKYEIGNLDDGDWRESWHSTAWMVFRKKMAKIHIEKFHLYDADWSFCQQCSHLPINQRNLGYLKER